MTLKEMVLWNVDSSRHLKGNTMAALRKNMSKAKFSFIKCGLSVKHVFKVNYLENNISI